MCFSIKPYDTIVNARYGERIAKKKKKTILVIPYTGYVLLWIVINILEHKTKSEKMLTVNQVNVNR